MEKKAWQKPKLIVLTRHEPQEVVLTVCKHGSTPGQPYNFYTGCLAEPGCQFTCEAILTS